MPTRLEKYTAQFTERLLDAIQNGSAPWQKPWRPGEMSTPHNFNTAHQYQGGNLILLMATAAAMGYSDPRWGGFRQIRSAGGCVRKGEKGTLIMICRPSKRNPDEDADDEPERRMYRSFHYVFNVEQADGLELAPLSERPPASWEPADVVRQIAADTRIEIVHQDGDKACYQPFRDRIVMPLPDQFHSRLGYEQTLLHELAHATAHPSRLAREVFRQWLNDREAYAIEELRAEISSMMLGDRLRLGHEPHHGQAYVKSWIRAVRNDPDAVRRAATDATDICQWLLRNISLGQSNGEEHLEAA